MHQEIPFGSETLPRMFSGLNILNEGFGLRSRLPKNVIILVVTGILGGRHTQEIPHVGGHVFFVKHISQVSSYLRSW